VLIAAAGAAVVALLTVVLVATVPGAVGVASAV
jgi:hypothetical protein